MANFYIIGAGMAGLLAANMLETMGHQCLVYEAQPSLPNNHHAVLRFRSSIVSDVTGIPFKKVNVLRTVQPWRNDLADTLAYSRKATGEIAMRSSLGAKNSGVAERFIAPPDFIEQMSEKATIIYETPWNFYTMGDEWGDAVISTIPMPALAKVLGYSFPDDSHTTFRSTSGYNMSFDVPGIDVYGTVYLPDPKYIWYRVSVTGTRVVAEYSDVGPKDVNQMFESMANDTSYMDRMDTVVARRFTGHFHDALEVLGIDGAFPFSSMAEVQFKKMQYQKILPISDVARKRFMAWASEQQKIYSLGRFATWRPGLLLDDLVNDVRQIERMATGDNYHRRMKGVS